MTQETKSLSAIIAERLFISNIKDEDHEEWTTTFDSPPAVYSH
jgi:hypothetical protein